MCPTYVSDACRGQSARLMLSAKGHSERAGSPAERPTLNTNVLGRPSSTSTTAERSPHLSAVSNSSHSSPWSQHMALSGQAQSLSFHPSPPQSTAPESASQNNSPVPPNDWNSLFSAPLDPSVFAALAASGVLGPATPGIPSSLPTRNLRSPAEISQNSRGQAFPKDMTRSGSSHPIPNGWPAVPSSYSPASMSQRLPSHARSNPNSVSFMKRRSPIAGKSYDSYLMLDSNSSACHPQITALLWATFLLCLTTDAPLSHQLDSGLIYQDSRIGVMPP